MAGKLDNIKGLFSNSRTRIIILFTLFIIIAAIIVGIVKMQKTFLSGDSNAFIGNTPGNIDATPGSLDPTAQYAGLVDEDNKQRAKKALQTGGSAIPTIIKEQEFGKGVDKVGTEGGQSFTNLQSTQGYGQTPSIWGQDLKNENCSVKVIKSVVGQGATLQDVHKTCDCSKIKSAGYPLKAMRYACPCTELKKAGFSALDLKNVGFDAKQLSACGFDACQLRSAGFSAPQLKAAGFSDGELKGAGFSPNEIKKAGGLPNGVTADDVRKAGCNVQALRKLRQEGVSALAIRRISGCSAKQLKDAGYNAKQLKDAGFTPAELKDAGFTPKQLKDAGFTAKQLKDAGFTPDELAQAGFSPDEIKKANEALPPGITPLDVKKAGCNVDALRKEREDGVSAAAIREYAHCDAASLRKAGFTPEALAQAGFTPEQIRDAEEALPPGITPLDVKKAGCKVDALRKEREAGVSAAAIRKYAHCDAEALKAAGFSNGDLKAAGFTPEQIKAANDALPPGVTEQDVKRAGCNPTELALLRAKGVSASTIVKLNHCTANALKAAGYTPKELLDAGFTPKQLKDAGFSDKELAGLKKSPASLLAAVRNSHCSVSSLKAAREAGIKASEIRKVAGCSAKQFKDAGFNAKQLKDAGFSAAQLKAAGFSPKQLKDAGFTAKQLKDAGFNAKQLKDAGFTPRELKDAGFSARDLKNAGFTPKQLLDAGFTPKQLKDAGFSARDLKKAGLDDDALKQAGFNLHDEIPSLDTADANENKKPKSQLQKQADELQALSQRQNARSGSQKLKQTIDAKVNAMMSAANQSLNDWRKVQTQVYVPGTEQVKQQGAKNTQGGSQQDDMQQNKQKPAIIKAGDIMFAVIDTSVNSDEPGPILATVVSGRFKGAKLIGSFNLPSNAQKLVIKFNQMSVPGAPKTTSINAYAIDSNTARTALSSRTDNHYLLRYGSLFASSFLEGFGQAFQSANTTITIGGTTTGAGDVTISNGVGRSVLENAVIGLADVGQAWGQQAQQLFNRPTTVEVFSGTGVGILFTSDLSSL